MNDGNIRYYLESFMSGLKADMKQLSDEIEGAQRKIDDWTKELQMFKIHYTSLLNTAIAYGSGIEEDEQDNTD